MRRIKGATNKKLTDHPEFLDMPAEERLIFFANLIVDQVLEDPASVTELLKTLCFEEALV